MEVLVIKIVLSVIVILAVAYAFWDKYKKTEDKRIAESMNYKAYLWLRDYLELCTLQQAVEIDMFGRVCYVWLDVPEYAKAISHVALNNKFGLVLEYKYRVSKDLAGNPGVYDIIIRVDKPKYKDIRRLLR